MHTGVCQIGICEQFGNFVSLKEVLGLLPVGSLEILIRIPLDMSLA